VSKQREGRWVGGGSQGVPACAWCRSEGREASGAAPEAWLPAAGVAKAEVAGGAAVGRAACASCRPREVSRGVSRVCVGATMGGRAQMQASAAAAAPTGRRRERPGAAAGAGLVELPAAPARLGAAALPSACCGGMRAHRPPRVAAGQQLPKRLRRGFAARALGEHPVRPFGHSGQAGSH
jgi:hypothetical protein